MTYLGLVKGKPLFPCHKVSATRLPYALPLVVVVGVEVAVVVEVMMVVEQIESCAFLALCLIQFLISGVILAYTSGAGDGGPLTP